MEEQIIHTKPLIREPNPRPMPEKPQRRPLPETRPLPPNKKILIDE